jgi:hypothetical protein
MEVIKNNSSNEAFIHLKKVIFYIAYKKSNYEKTYFYLFIFTDLFIFWLQ